MKRPQLSKMKKPSRLWSKDWFLRIISLILAIVLWYLVGGEDKVNKTVMIPVEIINLSHDLVISNQYKKQIEMTVSGPRSLILEMSKGEITRQINLSKAEPGTNVIPNKIDSIPVPRGVTVERIVPSSIILSLDKLVQKQFSVLPVVIDKVPVDYELGEVGIDPNEIAITGPGSVLEHLDVLKTRPISVDGLKESVHMQVPLDLSPAIVDLIGETSVTAKINITMRTIKKKIKNVPVVVELDGIQLNVNPPTVTIIASVPRVFVKEKRDLKALFDVTASVENAEGRMEIKVTPQKEMKDAVTVLEIDPLFVTLKEGEPKPSPSSGGKK